MNNRGNRITVRDVIAVLVSLASLAGLYWMFTAEGHVIPEQHSYRQVLSGLISYSWAIGLILVAVSIAYILLGHENDIVTTADEPKKEQ